MFRNQINPGGTAVGTPQMVTTILDPIDDNPDFLAGFSDLTPGAASRGTGPTGTSRLYISFDSTLVEGTYSGRSVPELNNSIIQISF